MVKMKVNSEIRKATINKNIYGHFAEHLGRCVYEGIWVGKDSPIPNINGIRKDVVEALKLMKIPVLRWPGGCFADNYHWTEGIGPYKDRPSIINTHWGGVTENNHFGTHEFMEFCDLIGAEPYIGGNLGSGTVREMQQWVEYMTSNVQSPMTNLRKENGREEPWKLKYFAVGNENWGCGGQMRPEYYADEYRRYATYLGNFGDNKLYKIACGANADDYQWTEVLMKNAGKYMDGLSLHYYTMPLDWSLPKGSAVDFDEKEWFNILKMTLYMEELIEKNIAIMDKYDEDKRVGLIVDEWGAWYQVEQGTNPSFLYQQNTLRDALVAGINLNLFNNHCDRIQMANIAQMINVLQSVILTDGHKMILTPTYHVFKMFSVHQNAQLLETNLEETFYYHGDEKINQLSASSSIDSEGKIHISLCNLDPFNNIEISCELMGTNKNNISGTILTSNEMDARNTFEYPETIMETTFNNLKLENNQIYACIPAKSVVVLKIE
ncbi:MAG TPA: alpha-N-arabinofuranosidase [Epulopiscium sp.]|nr:alpha-N-arabinofuranosidase [Candidatus Epulonipiscium sp.]